MNSLCDLKRLLLPLILIAVPCVAEEASEEEQEFAAPVAAGTLDAVPDIREEKLKFGSGNLLAVPIPISSPTFGSGLVAVGGYYYGQTEAQKKVQPPSFTGLGGVYTTTDSYAFGLMHQQYWKEDRWRFTGSAGYGDMKLELVDPVSDNEQTLDWLVKGYFAQLALSRRVFDSHWFVGGHFRYLEIDQDIDVGGNETGFNVGNAIRSPSLGLSLLYDTRDNQTNPYSGIRFDTEALFSGREGKDVSNYQALYARLRGYHQVATPLVVAWEARGCTKSGDIPLWDTCRVGLRGFPITRYLSRKSASAQVEVRWNFYRRLGLVAFGGVGTVEDATRAEFDEDVIPSYGIGVRFMVMKAQRINLRIDYARSDSESAWYLGVVEYF